MPLLTKKLNAFQDDNDRKLLPLFECLEQVIAAIGEELATPYVQLVYERCVSILYKILQAVQQDPREGWYAATDFYLRSMDLLSAILTTMNDKSAELIQL